MIYTYFVDLVKKEMPSNISPEEIRSNINYVHSYYCDQDIVRFYLKNYAVAPQDFVNNIMFLAKSKAERSRI